MLRHPVTLAAEPASLPRVAKPVMAPVVSTAFQRFGFAMLCLYAIGPALNDIARNVFGFVPHLTLIPLALLWLCTVFGGGLGRAFQVSIGRWWLALFAIMMVSTVFSIWPGGSTALLADFGPKRYVILFCIAAVQVSATQCIRFAYLQILSSALLLFMCFFYGTTSISDGRFFIGQSMFFDNSNDLAIALLLTSTSLLFVFFARGFVLKILATCEILLSLFYILKSGSRGTFLAALVAAVFVLIFSKRKIVVLWLVPALLIALITFAPSQMIQRFMSVVIDPERAVASGAGGSEVESQLVRQDMVKLSLKITLQHPLLGVGPGMFDNFVQKGAKETGVHAVSLNTHNAYTQVSSECGILAFICYMATIILTIKLNHRMFKALPDQGGQVDPRLTGIAFSGLIGTIGYAVASIFHHLAFAGDLPWLSGGTVALWLVTQPMLSRSKQQAARVG
jgi:O-antigen ligase